MSLHSFCVICAHPFVSSIEVDKNQYKDTCPKCRKILKEEAPGIPLYGDGLAQLDEAIEELNARIPGLFVGPECPGSCFCDCTYEGGCKLLNKKKEAESSTSKKNMETMKKVLDKRSQVWYNEGKGRGGGRLRGSIKASGYREFKGYEPHKTTKEERLRLLEKALSNVKEE